MWKHHLTLAGRALWRHKGYTVIHLLGLAVGIACCALAALFVRDELSFNRFHAHADRIAFVGVTSTFAGEQKQGLTTDGGLAATLVASVPEVEAATRLLPGRLRIVDPAARTRTEQRLLRTDPAFFEVFSFPFVSGSPRTALERPDAVVLSASAARRFFGPRDPVGQPLAYLIGDSVATYTVTGVVQDAPATSSITFDLIGSVEALRPAMLETRSFQTFALLRAGTRHEDVERKLAALSATVFPGEAARRPVLFARPFADLYLSDLVPKDGFKGSPVYLRLFSAIALFLLALAVINYVNLATARGATRAREVGVRKTLGADRRSVAGQFLTESVLLSVLAFGLAGGLLVAVLPAFNRFFGKAIALAPVHDGAFWAGALGATLGLGLLAGAYPALYLSRFQPARVLRGTQRRDGRGSGLRKVLVVVQFSVTVALVAATVVVYRQIGFARHQLLGAAGEAVLVADLPTPAAARQYEALKAAFLSLPGVERVAGTSTALGGSEAEYQFAPDPLQPDRQVAFSAVEADADYLAAFGLRVTDGRFFSADRPSDLTQAYVVNETGARALAALGWREVVGHTFGPDTPGSRIVGVVEDFHFNDLHTPIKPLFFRMRAPWGDPAMPYSTLALRLRGDVLPTTLTSLEQVWRRFVPDEPFAPAFLDERVADVVRTERRLGQLFTAFAGIAILVACLGLFGLVAFTTQQRTREIGVRKVLGASVASLVALLSRDLLALVAVAAVVAGPGAYLMMRRWLETFAYHVPLGPEPFLLAGALALVVALLTASAHTVRAATADPVRALRSE